MKRFKINQRVRIVNNDGESTYLPHCVGKTGYIGGKDDPGFDVYSELNRKGEYLGYWYSSELEPVRSRPRKTKERFKPTSGPRKTVDDFMSKGSLERPLPVESHTFLLNGKKAEVTMDSERVTITIYEM